mgnify:FL=1|jgi:hypothetical protein
MAFLVQGGAPPDDSVTTAKIQANAVDETKLKDALVADFTEVTVAAGDSILLGDVNDSGNTKRDTVQGILDLAGGGGYSLVESVDITSSTAVTTFSHTFAAGYDYLITCRQVEFAADGTSNDPPMVQLGTGSTPDWLVGSYTNASLHHINTTITGDRQQITTGIPWPALILHGGTSAGEFSAMTWEFFNPGAAEATHCKTWCGISDHDGAASMINAFGSAMYPTSSAVTKMRIDPGAQNMDLAQIELMRRSIT